MDDLISRQAAIDDFYKYPNVKWTTLDVLEHINALPSAERRGRWVDGKRMGFDGTFYWFRQCSECLYEREDDNPEKDTNYCPNCGARMDGHFKEPEINPCRGCEDYDGKGGCISNGGCGARMEVE